MAFVLKHAVKRLFKAQNAAQKGNVLESVQGEVAPRQIGQAQPEEKSVIVEAGHADHIVLPKEYAAVEARVDVLEKLRTVAESYPLVTTSFKGMRYVVATATIRFNPVTNQLMYLVEEPVISDYVKETIKQTLRLLQDRLEIEPSKLKARREVYNYVDEKINEIWDYLGASLTEDEELKAKYYILRGTIGYGYIEPLMRDPDIEDISCDGVGQPVFVFHRNPSYGELITNISFGTKEELDSFVMKLAQKAGRTISVATPLLDATLPDGSRLQVTFGTDIARKGSNFSIRKFFKSPLTVVDLIKYGTANPLLLAYLWLIIDEQQSLLITGTTAVGKTTFLNSVAQFIKPGLKIVSIEDTAELQLTNVNWVPQVARTGYGPKKYGEVTMFDLLKAALRQRPDYLVVGEVRGREASVMFQAMATGHPALSTLHADSINAVMDRLTTRPIDLPVSLLENLDAIVFLEKINKDGKLIRRVAQILEIEGYDRNTNMLKTNIAFSWDPAKDIFETHDSAILAKIAAKRGQTPEQLKDELLRRANLLVWMAKKDITKFRDVANMINLYYTNPAQLATFMRA
jgi:flagellar protein FlaI